MSYATQEDTIVAIATAPGRAGIAVIRISGKNARSALKHLGITQKLKSRYAHYVSFRNIKTNDIIDQGLVLWFPAPHSFTGEDVAECHVHGSKAVLEALLDYLTILPHIRIAEPGEFSKRAFYHQKMDLTRAEGLADLIDSETQLQRRQALKHLQGGLESLYENWRKEIITMQALLEAYIEFPDESIPKEVLTHVYMQIDSLRTLIAAHLNDGHRGEKLKDGLYAIIIGAPNVGKSTLLNALAQRDVAIVSSIKGTTRDIIEVPLEIAGYPVIFADTAGLHESDNSIENEGMKRALAKTRQADLVIAMFDVTDPEVNTEILPLISEKTIIVMNKTELNIPYPIEIKGKKALPLSLHTGDGLDILLTTIEHWIKENFTPPEHPVITRKRYRDALTKAAKALKRSHTAFPLECVGEELRAAAYSIGQITGVIDIEEILDCVFSRFCIGK